jgi:hypothetical protein
MPIRKIGEGDWVEKLTCFLEEYGVDVIPLDDKNLINKVERRLKWKFPQDLKDYYLSFGGIDSPDFMCNLKRLDEYTTLSNSFIEETGNNCVIFAESPANEPLCIDKQSCEIYLFSYDPFRYAKVYNDFNDYLISEIINIQELFGELEFDSKKNKINFMSKILQGDNIDYVFRNIKLE